MLIYNQSYYDNMDLNEVKIVENKFHKYQEKFKLKILENMTKFNHLKILLSNNNVENNFNVKILHY